MAEHIPSGIESFDMQIGGGFPRGSMVLLMGEIGAGQDEFAITVAERAASARNKGTGAKVFIPRKIAWMCITRDREEVMRTASRFHSEFCSTFSKGVEFLDFFVHCLSSIPLPVELAKDFQAEGSRPRGMEGLVESGMPGEIKLLSSMAGAYSKLAGDMVVIDSLTDLSMMFRSSGEQWKTLTVFLQWMKRSCMSAGGITYAILNRGPFDEKLESELCLPFTDIVVFSKRSAVHGETRTISIRKSSGRVVELPGETRLKMGQWGVELERAKLIRKLA